VALTAEEEQAQEEQAAAAPDPDVAAMLEMLARKGEDPRPRDHDLNISKILDHDPRIVGRIRHNDFAAVVEIDGQIVTDDAESELRLWVSQVYGIHPPSSRFHEVLSAVARRHAYHPVRDYLDGLSWDGVDRLDHWLVDYLGVSDEDGLSGPFGRKTLISAVARVYEPGCKVDTVLVLQGGQGVGKSTALRHLTGGAWFCDSTLAIGEKDGYQALQGVWVYELAELDAVRRSDWSAVKAFLSAQVDRFRPSYGRNTVHMPRQIIFTATVNESEFLGDSTGSRRFWVRHCSGDVRPDAVKAQRDQLWAEALTRYRRGEQWWLSSEEEAARQADAEQYRQADPWEETIRVYLTGRQEVHVTEILEQALKRDVGSATKLDQMRVAAVLGALGWVKRRTGAQRATRWVKA
jgi:putative DNA primase/helicase